MYHMEDWLGGRRATSRAREMTFPPLCTDSPIPTNSLTPAVALCKATVITTHTTVIQPLLLVMMWEPAPSRDTPRLFHMSSRRGSFLLGGRRDSGPEEDPSHSSSATLTACMASSRSLTLASNPSRSTLKSLPKRTRTSAPVASMEMKLASSRWMCGLRYCFRSCENVSLSTCSKSAKTLVT